MIAATTCHRSSSNGLPQMRCAAAFAAMLMLAFGVLAGDARADGNSTSNSRATSRTESAPQVSTPDLTRPEMIVLPWFSPGIANQPLTAAPTAQPQTQASAPVPSSVIQLPAFSPLAAGPITPFPVTPNRGNPPPKRKPPKHKIPEIDPASAANALTLLIGGVILLTDRRRRIRCC